MSATLTPANTAELAEAVRVTPRLIAVGAGTKPRLAAGEAVKLSTAALRGMVEYDPGEFTFTALAGTPMREIVAALAEGNQYLPFDPMLVAAGATLGGTVAAGLSGPGRFRFGGVRDFILAVQFVDGAGRLLRMGGKVVKNAAGFDLPKFFVGSVGRFGVLTEITFKVFPRPASELTLKLETNGIEAAAQILVAAASSRWEPDALDRLPDGHSVGLRLAGPPAALESLAREILARWPGRKLTETEAVGLWTELREFRWAPTGSPLLKVAIAPGDVVAFHQTIAGLDGVRAHISAGGNVAFVSLAAADQFAAFDEKLRALRLSAVTLRGDTPLWSGARTTFKISRAVKAALDAENRFPSLDD